MDSDGRVIDYTPHKVNKMIHSELIVVFYHPFVPACREAMRILLELVHDEHIRVIEAHHMEDGEYILDYMSQLVGSRDLPYVFIRGKYHGGIEHLKQLRHMGVLERILLSPKMFM